MSPSQCGMWWSWRWAQPCPAGKVNYRSREKDPGMESWACMPCCSSAGKASGPVKWFVMDTWRGCGLAEVRQWIRWTPEVQSLRSILWPLANSFSLQNQGQPIDQELLQEPDNALSSKKWILYRLACNRLVRLEFDCKQFFLHWKMKLLLCEFLFFFSIWQKLVFVWNDWGHCKGSEDADMGGHKHP